MKQKKIEIGLVGQAPSRRGDPYVNAPSRHVLHTAGFILEMFVNDRGEIALKFSPHPPRTQAQFERFFKKYQPWRNGIMLEWSFENKKRATLVDDFIDRKRITTFDNGRLTMKEIAR